MRLTRKMRLGILVMFFYASLTTLATNLRLTSLTAMFIFYIVRWVVSAISFLTSSRMPESSSR